jgi:hypothetical protein
VALGVGFLTGFAIVAVTSAAVLESSSGRQVAPPIDFEKDSKPSEDRSPSVGQAADEFQAGPFSGRQKDDAAVAGSKGGGLPGETSGTTVGIGVRNAMVREEIESPFGAEILDRLTVETQADSHDNRGVFGA